MPKRRHADHVLLDLPILVPQAPLLLVKARKGDVKPGHKYTNRKRDANGEWVYEYAYDTTPAPQVAAQPVGIPDPHRIQFYATIDSDSIRDYMPAMASLFPVSSWVRKAKFGPDGMVAGKIPPIKLPAHMRDPKVEKGADGGGFVAARIWGGEYKFTLDQYIEWLDGWRPTWAAMLDFCCEPAIASSPSAVRERQAKTTANAHEAWAEHQDAPWAWVPTVQGWTIDDYVRHARELKPLIADMMQHYTNRALAEGVEDRPRSPAGFRVGVGTLCCRTSRKQIAAIVRAVAAELPGVPLHLWGVKLDLFKMREALPDQVVSSDSAAWSMRFGADIEAYKQSGLSQREHAYTVALPDYIDRIQSAQSQPKQDDTPDRNHMMFQPIDHLPPEALWRLVDKHILKGRDHAGFSITSESGWSKLNIWPKGRAAHSSRDVDDMMRALIRLQNYGYLYANFGGSVWSIEVTPKYKSGNKSMATVGDVLSKARKGEQAAGHKYEARTWDTTAGHFVYHYRKGPGAHLTADHIFEAMNRNKGADLGEAHRQFRLGKGEAAPEFQAHFDHARMATYGIAHALETGRLPGILHQYIEKARGKELAKIVAAILPHVQVQGDVPGAIIKLWGDKQSDLAELLRYQALPEFDRQRMPVPKMLQKPKTKGSSEKKPKKTLRDIKQEALQQAIGIGDDEYVRVVRTSKGQFSIEQGIGTGGDSPVWLISGKGARKGWYTIK